MNETLRTIDGRPVLRMERWLAHPPAKVWRAITDPAHLSQWYPFQALELDLRLGGKIRFDDGQGMIMDAVITELDPPRAFAFSERAPAEMERESDDLVHFELRPDGAGCLLIFTHTFDDRPAAASYASGWHTCLDALELLLDGRPIEMPDVSAELHEAYFAAFGLAEGTAEQTADGWRVRFERQLMRQPIDKVWAALTNAALGGPKVGGRVPAGFTSDKIPAGAVTAVEPSRLLEYEWLSDGKPAGRVRWELSGGPGGARISLSQTGLSSPADQQPVALAAWREQIERFVKDLVGKPAADGLGTLSRTDDGRYALRFERRLAHPPEKVWRAITEWQHLRAWFPAIVEFDLRPGAELRFGATPEQQRRYGMSADQVTLGAVTQVDPPRLLEYSWGDEILRWELQADGAGGCRMVFTNIVDDRDTAVAAAAGWHAGLEVVAAQLDGRPLDWSAWDRAEQLSGDYTRSFGTAVGEMR
jgi:uncharacterized protein YndB with AHSA1/START domain